ncbi:MarR family winged helix-turn-helix transcriptional regulator [Furfurilactobacillus milii]|uniref:MarR family transcriptional regulator n=1 Tax=Furfurilactobacillus milii TaxID=2888272 RepID=A0ABT6D904_9LACO|nr:MarR family transcriptional regulator [Furfurilactobacillus milii]QLE67292.1 Transcriptional regulator MarR [Furfurilactobacillus rossiae]MCF6161018.1 MarR family transcriptional regulator [Furfurilactobacillus milii]MCF6163492.1 MarR family transcriptional regulator [Furfurilactobacillus milii]MDF9913550.1 MarR family transcriptional regulator [Furfurilactobacillus milii]QLE69722.1 Transcriptional regulator MarR family [Furfurilactobacillus rossiae]
MEDVLRSIGKISRALDAISNIDFQNIDLTKGQYLYLVRICENPGIIQGRLAELVMVDRTTVSQAIKKLVNHGFITRKHSETNLKNYELYPTAKGTAVYPRLKRENAYSTDKALQGFSKAEAQQLAALLERMTVNVNEDWKSVKAGVPRDH